MKASYLSNADILKYIDSLTLRTLFVRMKILDKNERPIKTIEGRATGGSISINASSAVRRTGNITLVASESEIELDEDLKTLYKVTDVDNLISMNKRVEIEVGLKNTGLEYKEYDVFWIPLGQFLITNASVTHNTQGIQIQVKLTDKMALLNGEVGGTMPGVIIHSPYEDLLTGEKFQALFFTLIRELVSEIGEIPDNKIIIEDINERVSTGAFWKNISTTDNIELVSYKDPDTNEIIYEIKQEGKDYTNLEAISYIENERVGILNTDFVYPNKELASTRGDSVASMLDKIAKELGNFEYFFDLDGNFRFRQIRNYLNEGSTADDITVAIAEGYFINSSVGKSLYSFEEGVNLISSYGNNPIYANIKNDYTIWGKKRGSDTAIRYHLIIDNKKLFSAEEQQLFQNKDSFDVWLATVSDTIKAFPTEQAARTEVLTSLKIDPNKTDANVTITTFGRWQFYNTIIPGVVSSFTKNNDISIIMSKQVQFSLQNAEDEKFVAIRSYMDNNKMIVEFNAVKNNVYNWIRVYEDGWKDEKYRAITFGNSAINLPQSFYQWLTYNAEYQEKFISSGLYSFKESIILQSLNAWNTEFYLYDLGKNTETAEKFFGIWITSSSILYKNDTGEWFEVYRNGEWNEIKYKYLFFKNSYHIDDNNYNWFKNYTFESKVLTGGEKWQFNNIIDLVNFPGDIPLQFGIFETISGTKNNYSAAKFNKIIKQNSQLIAQNNYYLDKQEIMYENGQWKIPEIHQQDTDSFQYFYISGGAQTIALDAYNWLTSNAKKYTVPYLEINGKWKLKNNNGFSTPQGYYDFNTINRSEEVIYTVPFNILRETQNGNLSTYSGSAFIISTTYNEIQAQHYGPKLSVKYKVSNSSQTYLGEWLDKHTNYVYNWKKDWKYIDFGIGQMVSIYFYNWFTANFVLIEENNDKDTLTTYTLRQTTSQSQEYIKAGEVWKLKDNPWLSHANVTLSSAIGLVNPNQPLALFFDTIRDKELDDLISIHQIDIETDPTDALKNKLFIERRTIYQDNQWTIAPPIAIKFLQSITDMEFFNAWNAIAEKHITTQTVAVATQKTITKTQFEQLDWRLQRYYYYVMTCDISYLGKEMKENIPKLFNIQDGTWKSQSLTDQEYFIDMIDLDDVLITNNPTLIGTIDSITKKKYVSQSGYEALAKAYEFAVHKIQRRAKVIDSQEVNCLFRTGSEKTASQIDWTNSVFVLNEHDPSLNANETVLAQQLQEEAAKKGQCQVIVPKEVFTRLSVLDPETPAYDLLRSQLHEFLSYNENINLTTVPVYHLDVNTRITVNDDKSDIHGDYLIQSIQIPLTINGQMTINAKRAIERI